MPVVGHIAGQNVEPSAGLKDVQIDVQIEGTMLGWKLVAMQSAELTDKRGDISSVVVDTIMTIWTRAAPSELKTVNVEQKIVFAIEPINPRYAQRNAIKPAMNDAAIAVP